MTKKKMISYLPIDYAKKMRLPGSYWQKRWQMNKIVMTPLETEDQCRTKDVIGSFITLFDPVDFHQKTVYLK